MNTPYIARRTLSGLGILAVLVLAACGAPQLGATTTPSAPPSTGSGCAGIEQLETSSPEAQRILSDLLGTLLAQRLPNAPAAVPVGFAEVRSITRSGDWALVHASFTQVFEPGIFVLQRTENGYRYDGQVWGGMAESMEEIRASLADQVPAAPRELFSCLGESPWFGLSGADMPDITTTPEMTAGPATEPSAPVAGTPPVTADDLDGLDWTRKQFGTAWNVEYPSAWTVDEAGVHAGAVRIEGTYAGRRYAIELSYPIVPGLDTLTLDDWVRLEVGELATTARDITVAGADARKVLGVRPEPAQPEQHRVYVWKQGITNPQLVTIHQTDGGPVAEAMELLLDRFIAGIEAAPAEMATTMPATTTAEAGASARLADIRREIKHPIWVPTELPEELEPGVPVVEHSGGSNQLVTIEYRTFDDRMALHVLNGAAGCCLDTDPRKRQNPVQLASGVTAYFIPVEPQYGGNILWWQQEGAYVALSGPELTQDQLLRIANSMSSTSDIR